MSALAALAPFCFGALVLILIIGLILYMRSRSSSRQAGVSPASQIATIPPLDFAPFAENTAPALPFDHLTRRQRSALLRQAKSDYTQARGHAHLQRLQHAYTQRQTELAKVQTAIAKLTAQQQALEIQWRGELQAALEYHLLHERLDEVEGIGEALKARILNETKARTFAELQQAPPVSGIGENRRAAIQAWIQGYRAKMPQLLAEDFPGRLPIDRKYQDKIPPIHRAVEHQQQIAAALQKRLDEIHPHLAWLASVTPQTFAAAAAGRPDAQNAVARFMIGLYPAWEAEPDWLAKMTKE